MATDVHGIAGAIAHPDASSRAAGGATSATSTTRRAEETSATARSDSVVLSTPTQIRALVDSVRDIPVVDSNRVQAVRATLASGETAVDPTRVAEKLIDFESVLHPDRI